MAAEQNLQLYTSRHCTLPLQNTPQTCIFDRSRASVSATICQCIESCTIGRRKVPPSPNAVATPHDVRCGFGLAIHFPWFR